MADEIQPAEDMATTGLIPGDLAIRSEERREIEALIVPWNDVIDSPLGPETFLPGSFRNVNPKRVVLRLEHENPAAGVGMSIEERSDGPRMVFKVSRTQRGDEILTLARDGVTSHVSVGFDMRHTKSEMQVRSGRRVTAHTDVDLREVSTTWMPAYNGATVLSVRSEKEPEMAEDETPTVEVTTPKESPVLETRDNLGFEKAIDRLTDRLEHWEERARSGFEIPGPTVEKRTVAKGEWMEAALRILSGERIADSQYRVVADVISSDNAGLVPDAYSTELIGVIDPARPFMQTTRRIPTPASGMSLVVPVITQRPTVALQATEKTELSSTTTKISTKTFDMVTKGGVGDISLQLLKRADRSFLDLYMQLLAEAYAIEADDEAVRALLDAAGGVNAGTALNPEALALGDAYTTSFDAIRRPPDTIWLSTEAIGAFIDAMDSGTNRPLYSDITSNITTGGGARGTISGLRAVHVPALDAHGAFAIVGPSSGFAWAEDGTYTLQVDVPSKAGRDVALVGMLWFAPWYPAAFSIYNVAS